MEDPLMSVITAFKGGGGGWGLCRMVCLESTIFPKHWDFPLIGLGKNKPPLILEHRAAWSFRIEGGIHKKIMIKLDQYFSFDVVESCSGKHQVRILEE